MFITPDVEDNNEMRIVSMLVVGLGRANEFVFVSLLVLLVMYFTVRLLWAVLCYLLMLYAQYAFNPSPYTRFFRISLVIGVSALVLSAILTFLPQTHDLGVLVLCASFAVFSIVSAALDYYATRSVVRPALEDIDLKQIVQLYQEQERRQLP